MIESDYLKDNPKFIEKMRQIPTLKPFKEKDIKGLLSLSKIRKYKAGEAVLVEDSFEGWIYFLVSGKVKIVKHGEELSIIRRKGDVFGEMGIIDGSARSASVYAIEDTICLVTDASYIDRLSGDDRFAFGYILYRLFAEFLANRLRTTSDELIKSKEELVSLKINK